METSDAGGESGPGLEIVETESATKIALPVELDAQSADGLRGALLDALQRPCDIVIDGAAVARAATAPIQVLVAGKRTALSERRAFTFTNPSDAFLLAVRTLALENELQIQCANHG
jgi:anti-anti-sigma regulatory factor